MCGGSKRRCGEGGSGVCFAPAGGTIRAIPHFWALARMLRMYSNGSWNSEVWREGVVACLRGPTAESESKQELLQTRATSRSMVTPCSRVEDFGLGDGLHAASCFVAPADLWRVSSALHNSATTRPGQTNTQTHNSSYSVCFRIGAALSFLVNMMCSKALY